MNKSGQKSYTVRDMLRNKTPRNYMKKKNNFLKRWLHNDVFILQKDYKKRMLIAKVLRRNVV